MILLFSSSSNNLVWKIMSDCSSVTRNPFFIYDLNQFSNFLNIFNSLIVFYFRVQWLILPLFHKKILNFRFLCKLYKTFSSIKNFWGDQFKDIFVRGLDHEVGHGLGLQRRLTEDGSDQAIVVIVDEVHPEPATIGPLHGRASRMWARATRWRKLSWLMGRWMNDTRAPHSGSGSCSMRRQTFSTVGMRMGFGMLPSGSGMWTS